MPFVLLQRKKTLLHGGYGTPGFHWTSVTTLVMMLKDSALASTIAVTEMTRQGQLLAASTFDNTTVYTLVALLYLTLCMPLLAFTKHLENRQKKGA